MSTINEIKEEMAVVKSVGDFTNALEKIATLRMTKLRSQVLSSRPFVEAAHEMLKELHSISNAMTTSDLIKLEHKHKKTAEPDYNKWAVIVITSNQGLTGRYNIEIFKKVEKLLDEQAHADFYVLGKKGQEYFANTKRKVKYYPYVVPDTVEIEDLRRLINLFDHYAHITLVYSRYINSATREIVTTSIVNPVPEATKDAELQPGRYIFEPDIILLINGISRKLRAALFQQQLFDARLSQYSAQMIGMKTASDNANDLLGDLRIAYNKQRRKLIDKKISEVFAGSSLW